MLIVGGNQSAGGYEVANSIRFDKNSSQSLSRTCGSSASSYTLSLWVKNCEPQGGVTTAIYWNGAGAKLNWEFNGSSQIYWYDPETRTTGYYRDVSAWYHLVWKVSSNVGTLYVNGVADPGLTSVSSIDSLNSGNQIYIGSDAGAYSPQNGYFSEVCFIDGTALDPTSFGEYDEDSGIWKPIDVSGLTFGTNGFYLDFEDSSALGNDVSGNNNDLTANSFTSLNQSTDTPTNNFCTLNPLNFGSGTLSEGNLKWAAGASSGYLAFGTIGIDMGVSNQFYWETKIDSVGSGVVIGIAPPTLRWNDTGRAGSYGYYSNGDKYIGVSASSYGASFTTGDTIGVLAGNGTITFYKNGSSQGTAFTGLSGTYLPFLAEVSQTNSMNFGSPPYTISSGNTDPAGYGNFEYSTNGGYALNTKNLAEYG